MNEELLTIYEMQKRLCYREGRGLLELNLKGGNGEGLTFADLCGYYARHYRPLLEQLAKDKPDTAARFIVEDLDAVFMQYLREWEND